MTILCYHAVDDAWDSVLSVSVAEFEAQCEWLAAHRRVVHLDRAVEALTHWGRPRGGVAAITFDDGFASVLDAALPVLERHGLPATVFVVAETLLGPREVDWVDPAPAWPLVTLTLEQVLELQARGVRIGSHTMAHADLTTLERRECERDLRASRVLLEDLLGRTVPHLAYPGGFHDAGVRVAAERAGYSHAFALPERPEQVGPYAVPRVGVYRDNGMRTFRAKLTAPYLPLRTRLHSAGERLRRSA
jgi:peptidoglycan/xylan/chitin deacetylase (PgdA/CDA1 family)